MNWRVVFLPECELDLRALGATTDADADEIREAVHKYAIDGSGDIKRLGGDPPTVRIDVEDVGHALAELDEAAGTVYVTRIATDRSRFAPLLPVGPEQPGIEPEQVRLDPVAQAKERVIR